MKNSSPAIAIRSKADFPILAEQSLHNSSLRRNVRHATDVIRTKRDKVVQELPEWQLLRDAGAAIRRHTMLDLDRYLEQFEKNCARAGGIIHWARDAAEACAIAGQIASSAIERYGSSREVLKIKSMTTEEIGLNRALADAGIRVWETDLAELILQLGHDWPSHIVVPAFHINRQQIREIFSTAMNLPDLGNDPTDLAEAARTFLRKKFLEIPVAISGANFLLADTGGVVIVESEGNGRMCLTLPKTLITVAGIDKVLPTFRDLEVMLQLLPRSATGERMNPYNSIWTGVRQEDGPEEFHVILLDNGRSSLLADSCGRETLQCIRCGACQNICPVYRQTGGHAYGSVYAGPIGAILTPQLLQMRSAQSLPYASSLCGACYEVCPVKINIPEILIALRQRVSQQRPLAPEAQFMRMAAAVFQSERKFQMAQRLARRAMRLLARKDARGELWLQQVPGPFRRWTATRDLRGLPAETFREWWKKREEGSQASAGRMQA